MSHPLVLGLFDAPDQAATAARALRDLGVSAARVSIVAGTHDEEGVIARASGATPGAELEDSRPASRLGELSAHLLAAAALVLPGIGPILAYGPLAAGLGEAAGHLAGGLGRTLERAGVPKNQAEEWESLVQRGAVLIGAHVPEGQVAAVCGCLEQGGASSVALGTWPD